MQTKAYVETSKTAHAVHFTPTTEEMFLPARCKKHAVHAAVGCAHSTCQLCSIGQLGTPHPPPTQAARCLT